MDIPLHKPYWGKKAEAAVVRAMRTGIGVADGPESGKMREKLKTLTGARFALPVTSCTHGMELAVACLGAKTGDEVIVPSFTLAATATAAMIRGARPVFADIDPVTYCLDPADVERVITKRTVGIMTVHYAGMASENFERLLDLAKDHHLWVVEDAAHCIGSYYQPDGAEGGTPWFSYRQGPIGSSPSGPLSQGRDGTRNGMPPRAVSRGGIRKTPHLPALSGGISRRPAPKPGQHLGTFGVAGAFSFHGTKNVACGEGGAVVTNDSTLADKMEVFRAVGTDRQAFLQGKVSLYQWVGEGSSYLLSDILAALVNIQLDNIHKINNDYLHIASQYTKAFQPYTSVVQLPVVPEGMTQPNWHIYALKLKSADKRKMFVSRMREKGIEVSAHYVPLHTAPMGRKMSGRLRKLPVTEDVAATLVRLPIWAGMKERELNYIIFTVCKVLEIM